MASLFVNKVDGGIDGTRTVLKLSATQGRSTRRAPTSSRLSSIPIVMEMWVP
jgi:hypothetical protein